MNANGTHRRTLATNGTAPVFSPDGTKLAYLISNPSTHGSVIGVMDANGQHQHAITSPGPGNNDVKPDWQPLLRELRLAVSPRAATAGQRTCFSFRATSSGQGVAGALIRFAHKQAVSSGSGRATICASLSSGTHLAHASKAGYRPASAAVAARTRPPGFTG